MTYEQLKNLKSEEFKRFCGVHLETFRRMVKELEPNLKRTGKRGGSAEVKCRRPTTHQPRILAGVQNVLSYWQKLGCS
jgi:hypothetical protein